MWLFFELDKATAARSADRLIATIQYLTQWSPNVRANAFAERTRHMLTRRAATTLLAGVAAAPWNARADNAHSGALFYDAVGPTLTSWQIDIGNAALTRQASVAAPALIQYAWRHPTKLILYVASSNFVPFGKPDGKHHLTAFRIDPTNGALASFGAPVAIRARPINITVDARGKWLLTAYNVPSTMSVHPLGPDGAIGEEVKQATPIDGGIYAHQVRMFPSNRALVPGNPRQQRDRHQARRPWRVED